VPKESRYEWLLNEAHVDVGGKLNKALSVIETANTSLYDVLEHIDLTRKVVRARSPTSSCASSSLTLANTGCAMKILNSPTC